MEWRREQTRCNIGLEFDSIGCARIQPRRSTSARCCADARVVLDRARSNSLRSPGGHLDGRAVQRCSRDARYGGRRSKKEE